MQDTRQLHGAIKMENQKVEVETTQNPKLIEQKEERKLQRITTGFVLMPILS
jgi:hypothetical protein